MKRKSIQLAVEIDNDRSQHGELEPNLKKILHRNGIWGLQTIVMKFHLPISTKSVSVAPVRNNHKTSLSKVKSLNGQNFFNNKFYKIKFVPHTHFA